MDGEIVESLNDIVLNPVIKWKRKHNATKVAIIFSHTAFPNEEIFNEVVNDKIFDNTTYYSICTKGDLLDGIETRKECVKKACSKCDKFNNDKGCNHSCLLRLLWLMFECNNCVLEIFNKIKRDEQES
jgi:uncharacterized protein (UPF0332 family)